MTDPLGSFMQALIHNSSNNNGTDCSISLQVTITSDNCRPSRRRSAPSRRCRRGIPRSASTPDHIVSRWEVSSMSGGSEAVNDSSPSASERKQRSRWETMGSFKGSSMSELDIICPPLRQGSERSLKVIDSFIQHRHSKDVNPMMVKALPKSLRVLPY